MKKDPVLQLVLFIVACFLGIAVIITAGVVLAVPIAVCYVAYLVFQYVNNRPEPPPISTQQLIEKARAVYPTLEEYINAYLDRTIAEGDFPVFAITSELAGVTQELYEAENLNTLPVLVFPEGSIEEARYRDQLIKYQLKSADPSRTVQLFSNALFESFNAFKRHLPALAKDARYTQPDVPAPFSVPLIDVIPDIGPTIQETILPFFDAKTRETNLFESLRRTLDDNREASGKTPIDPADFKGDPREALRTYLRGTPFPQLFETRIPFDIPDSRMMEHCVIVAGAGTGKTQTLGALIGRYLERDDPPAMVVIDSTGALVKKIQTLALFNDRLKDRIVIIDPEHTPIPALNMFDISNPRLQGYSPTMKASIETEVVALFNYIFTSAANDLTSRQGTVFSYVVRLVLSIPNANITTLLNVLEENSKSVATSKYRPYIEALDATAQEFFKNQYYELKGFRDQIAQRVYSLIQIPAFREMFTTSNRIDFYDELQNKGSIVLVNTSEMLLKENASPLFGRYIIARTMASAFERAAIPEQQRRPTFLIIDECAPYVDDTFDKLLTRLRQFKLGVCAAFQHMEQVSEKLRSSIASNTSVKLAGGLGYSDSRWLARDMEATPEFLKAQRRDAAEPPKWTQLACYVRNYTTQAVSLTVPFYTLENMPQMTSAEYRALLERNRARVSSLTTSSHPSRQQESPSPMAETPLASAPNPGVPSPPVGAPPAQQLDDDAAGQWQ